MENPRVSGYYDSMLAAERLRRVYDIAPPRVRQYLDAEIDHVAGHIRPDHTILDLGCGYGRAMLRLAAKAALVVGVDKSQASLTLASRMLGADPRYLLVNADALALPFRTGQFDVIACIQNGLSAFHVDPRLLVAEAVRVTRPGGTVLLSTYSEKFWEHRLEWFRLQSRAGLLGELDTAKTGNGVIVCKDGFTGTAFKAETLMSLAKGLDVAARLREVDESSLWLEITAK
jgi:ubiquinone/menaquinone biosynthesis C-methylase UbiE